MDTKVTGPDFCKNSRVNRKKGGNLHFVLLDAFRLYVFLCVHNEAQIFQKVPISVALFGALFFI